MTDDPFDRRPVLHRPSDGGEADAAVAHLVEVLQTGLDAGDADHYDSGLAADVLWGSPYGQVLAGYAPLNTVHRSMMVGTPDVASRYEVVRTIAPAPDVVLAHVRRRYLADAPASGPARFSEMALYVLVRREGTWWLAAGQNTPIRDKPTD